MSLPRYQHTQVGWVARAVALLVLAEFIAATKYDFLIDKLAAFSIRPHAGPLFAIISLLIAAIFWNFATLTVEVTRDDLRWWFGVGLPRKSLPLREIQSAEVTRVPWWTGRGIRRTRDGWLYNVAGRDAVRLQIASGRKVLIGSDEPKRLVAALSHVRPGITRQ